MTSAGSERRAAFRASGAQKWAVHPARAWPRGGKRPAVPRGAAKRGDRRVPTLEALRQRENPAVPVLDDTRARRLIDLAVTPVTPWVEPALEDEFYKLAAMWRSETEHLSSADVFTHPDYQRIIGLGRPVLPLLLRDLAATGAHWFWALRAIAGENPVRAEDAGNVRRMTEAWLAWGAERGLA